MSSQPSTIPSFSIAEIPIAPPAYIDDTSRAIVDHILSSTPDRLVRVAKRAAHNIYSYMIKHKGLCLRTCSILAGDVLFRLLGTETEKGRTSAVSFEERFRSWIIDLWIEAMKTQDKNDLYLAGSIVANLASARVLSERYYRSRVAQMAHADHPVDDNLKSHYPIQEQLSLSANFTSHEQGTHYRVHWAGAPRCTYSAGCRPRSAAEPVYSQGQLVMLEEEMNGNNCVLVGVIRASDHESSPYGAASNLLYPFHDLQPPINKHTRLYRALAAEECMYLDLGRALQYWQIRHSGGIESTPETWSSSETSRMKGNIGSLLRAVSSGSPPAVGHIEQSEAQGRSKYGGMTPESSGAIGDRAVEVFLDCVDDDVASEDGWKKATERQAGLRRAIPDSTKWGGFCQEETGTPL
ncbi:hypothetical protein DFP72DRAFT_848737 [Ephemerocybe angulata]|uniref:Uncharacterized protein n=1 Tax=Ephemerocybe angulata TaxID=980116 RepID=A0A8H6HXT7_9AGAR|nr:hypothetical protein DFP72DRAFT_848737 [Tulosesus angulatus]